jgi:PEP-CTERM motif
MLLPATVFGGAYTLDDGSSENASYYGSQTTLWLNGFTATAGSQRITDIDVAFGVKGLSGNIPNGTSVNLLFYTDPNNDGNPADAVLQYSTTGLVANSGTDSFTQFAITPQLLTPGNVFYVAVAFLEPASGYWAVGLDINSPQGHSYQASWSAAPNFSNLTSGNNTIQTVHSANPTLDGNWMIRADGDAGGGATVPEPASILLTGVGLAGLMFLKRASTH